LRRTVRERPEGHQHVSKDFSAILATVSAFTVIGSTSLAVAREAIQDSCCLQGRTWGYPGNCAFSNYEQCMMSASGTNSSCGVNPKRAYQLPPPPPQPQQQQRGSGRSRN
jgi:hypothetical protein